MSIPIPISIPMAARELISTERKYVEGLCEVTDTFFTPLLERAPACFDGSMHILKSAAISLRDLHLSILQQFESTMMSNEETPDPSNIVITLCEVLFLSAPHMASLTSTFVNQLAPAQVQRNRCHHPIPIPSPSPSPSPSPYLSVPSQASL